MDERRVYVANAEWSIKDFSRHIINESLQNKAFTMFDVSDLIAKHRKWQALMPRVEPFFAVKCNYNKVLLQVLRALGVGFDCASKRELELMLSLGVSPDRIIFAHTAKPEDHIAFARSKAVDLLTFDSEFELVKIRHYYPYARLLLRIRSEAKVAVNYMGMKFGCCPHTEAYSLLTAAKKMNLNVVGVCFHVGSLCGELQAYERAIGISQKMFQMGKAIGHDMNILDIGGGFPGDINTDAWLNEISMHVNRALDKYFPAGCGVRIIAEPGRYFTASAFTLACRVHSARRTLRPDGKHHVMYYADDGLYGSFAGITSDRLIIDPQALDLDGAPTTECSLWGPTCDGIDLIARDIVLPQMPLPSWLLFRSFGAYTSSASTEFNGFGKPEEYNFADRETWSSIESYGEFTKVELPEELPDRVVSHGPDVSALYSFQTPKKRKSIQTHECRSPVTYQTFSPTSVKTN